MSYLLDKKIKRKKFLNIAIGIVFLIILFYFRAGIFNGLSYITGGIFRPVLILGNNVGERFGNLGVYFASKNSLSIQNRNLQTQLNEEEMRISNYNSLLAENNNLKEILNRKNTKIPMILATILAKPNQSIYDTLIVDVGLEQGLQMGNMVFALGNIPVGRVAEVYPNSAKVVLFSNPGEKTQAIISSKDIFMELIGRGGGNFEMVLPRDLTVQKGDQVVMSGINPYVLAVVETIISDPRDSFTKALLSSPVNIQELKFVEVEI
ncbi:MAG: rod shape-determining protein MreC [Candidatus Paceibacterota bacterium]